MVRRHELSDQEWELLAPLIPRAATGRPRVEDRQVINGMVYKIRTGISWRDLPERYGPWQTVYTRFRRYALDGVFTRALRQIQAHSDAAGDIDWLAKKGGSARVGGTEAIELIVTDKADKAGTYTFYVAQEGEPYLLKTVYKSAAQQTTTSFSGFDEPLNVRAPKPDEVLSAGG